ncbi:MAG: sulfatase-like hydrolase/transferase [Terriglobales bacterium]
MLPVAALAAQPPAPDVFLITIDTLRADRVECYGYASIRTPALNRLCRDGARFSRAFTPSPITNTSHASILTGLNPSRHGVIDFGVPLAASHHTWAELLKSRGYHTAAFIGAVILDSTGLAPGLDRGFDFYDNFPASAPASSRWGRVERRGGDVVRRAQRWLSAHRAGPRFVWVHLYDPHDPYEPPPPFDTQYRGRLYDGEIAYADSALGQFLSFLDRNGWYRNALIIIVGDHGEGLGEHQEETHGIFLYDSTLHVPLIVKLPGAQSAGEELSNQVRTTDILPTVLDLLGSPASSDFDGESLQPLWEGRKEAERVSPGETDYPLRFGWAPLRSLRTGGYKFIEAPRPELYDLRADAAETRNLYEPWNPEVLKLRAQLAEIRARAPQPQQPAPGAVDPRTIQELRALGYLGTDPGSTAVPEPSLLPDPKDKIVLQNLLHAAMLADEGGRTAEARAALKKLVQADPKSAVALLQLGQIELKEGNYEQAADSLARARALRPQDSAAALYHGQALEKSGKLAAARDALEDSLRLTPGQFSARQLLGRVYLQMGNLKAAQDQFEAAVFLEPKNAGGRMDLARVFLQNQRPADALDQLTQAAQVAPKDPVVQELLAQVYSALGQADLARKASARATLLRKKKAP